MPAKAKALVSDAKAAIGKNEHRLAEAKLRECLAVYGPAITIKEVRRSGCFRPSNYGYQTETIKAVVLALQSDFPDPQHQEYFTSILNLTWLAETAHGLVRDAQRKFDRKDIKTYLVALDFLFLGLVPRPGDKGEAWEPHSREALCSAFSYLYWNLVQTKTVKSSDFNHLNYRAIESRAVYETLASIASVLQLRNAELLVDHYDYVVTRDRKVCTIWANNPDFEKSIRLGHILLETQQFITATEKHDPKEIMSALELGRKFAETFEDRLVVVAEKPFRRVIVKLPFIDSFKEVVGDGSAFSEDITLGRMVQKELLLDPGLYMKPILEGLSARDLTVLQRFLLFLSAVLYFYCEKHGVLFKELHAVSQVKVFQSSELLKALTEIFDAPRAAAVLKILSWTPGPDGFFDLQYQPFIPAEDYFIIPISLCGVSSLSRNLLVRHGIRYDSESADDPVGDRLSSALQQQFQSVHRDVSYQWKEDGEIDVFVVGTDSVFAFECKNTLHPSSPFELRGAFQQLNDSVEQLNRLKTFYADPTFRQLLQKRLKLKDALPPILHVCTITGIRIFAGLRWQDVPTRPLWEMCNFVTTGINTLSTATDGQETELIEFRLWKNEQFSEADLIEALGQDSFWEMRLAAMEEVVHEYPLRGKNLAFLTYALDTLELGRLMSERYTIVSRHAVEPPAAATSTETT